MKSKRSVIVHYHTYKNSGTSFDELLTENYGEAHLSFDCPFPYTTFAQQELLQIVRRHEQKIAFSSHSIRVPVPTDLWHNILAAVFIRHPLARVRSIYGFETRKPPDLAQRARSILKKQKHTPDQSQSFDDWVTKKREEKDLHLLSNGQTQIFAGVYGTIGLNALAFPRDPGSFLISDLEQAMRNLQAVPLLARTEHYDEDVSRFPVILDQLAGIEFKYTPRAPANVSHPQADQTLQARLDFIQDELSPENWTWLQHANRQDLRLYEFAGELSSSNHPLYG